MSRYRLSSETWLTPGPIAGMDTVEPMFRIKAFETQTVQAVDGDVRTVAALVDSVQFTSPALASLGEPGRGGGAGGGGGSQMGARMAELLRGRTTVTRVNSRARVLSREITGGAQTGGGRLQGADLAVLPPFPEAAIQVGHTWTDSQVMTLGPGRGSPGLVKLVYRLARVEPRGTSRIAVIATTGSIGPSPEPMAAPPAGGGGGRPSLGVASGEVTGEALFDISRSRLVEVTSRSTAVLSSGTRLRMLATMSLLDR